MIISDAEVGPVKILAFLRQFLRWRDEWVIVLLAVLMLVIATNTQTGWLYVVVAVLAALLALGFILPRLTLRGLEVTRLAVPPAWEGDTVTIRLRVRNPSRWPRFVIGLEEHPPFPPPPAEGEARPEESASPLRFVIGVVPGGAGVTVEYPVHCRFRAALPFAPVTLGTGTPLGLFPLSRSFDTGGEIVVYPRAVKPPRAAPALATPRLAASTRTFHRAGSSYDLHGIREYQFGDDTRFVHWPTSARVGRLMLREFREVGAERVAILVDTALRCGHGPPGRTPLDMAARVAAWLVEEARRNAAHVTLLRGDAHGRPDMLHNARGAQALDWLARLAPSGEARWAEVALQAASHLERRARLIVLAAGPASADDLATVGARRLQVEVIVLRPGDEDAALDESAGRVAV
jgi:uncharacterized protein (DUF58 family)